MKIGFPKFRRSRKLLVITLGITVLLGGTAAAALYFKSKELGLERVESVIGGQCTDVLTMVLKTPSDRLWLRRFIRMENASGPERVRTALRVAGLLAKKNAVDLIHVSVLDAHGPTLRSQMRARSIGAEVLIAMKPDKLPEMKSPAMASYYEGPVSDEGRYYGDKVIVNIDEIGQIMTAMRSIEEKADCVGAETPESAEAKPKEHGKKEQKAEHGAKPEDAEGDKSAKSHGEEPAKEGVEDHASAETPAKDESFLDSMLSMVGLGGGDEKPALEPAVDNSHAVAEEPAEASAEDHGTKPADDDQVKASEHKPTPAAQAEHTEEAATDGTGHESATSSKQHGDEPELDASTKEEPAKPVKKADEHAQAEMPVGD